MRRDAIDILRLHHLNYVEDEGLAEGIDQLKQAGQVRSVCLIRHYRPDQEADAEQGPVLSTEADLVIYNYVCRWQEPGIRRSAEAGKAVLIMKATGRPVAGLGRSDPGGLESEHGGNHREVSAGR